MAKLKKHAEILDELQNMVLNGSKSKAASDSVQDTVTGELNSDTNAESLDDSTEVVDKNSVKPENNVQGYNQTASTDANAPLVDAKSAKDKSAADLGVEILESLRELKKQSEEAQDTVSGEPNKDTKATSLSDDTENVDKNNVKPEKNKEQEYTQEVSNDSDAPMDVATKVANYELGKQLASALLENVYSGGGLKQAQYNNSSNYMKTAQLKEAGKRDFEYMIEAATAQLKQAKQADTQRVLNKAAEEAGAEYYQQLRNKKEAADLAESYGKIAFEKMASDTQLAEVTKVAEEVVAYAEGLEEVTAKLAEEVEQLKAALAGKEAAELRKREADELSIKTAEMVYGMLQQKYGS